MLNYETLLQNGKVIDGTGNPWFYADVALQADRIVAIAPRGQLEPTNARQVVDATGHIVCPGFIDIQSHSILPLLRDGRCVSKITQGVTTEIMGEAWTPAPCAGRNTNPMENEFFQVDMPEWVERARGWSRFRHWLEAVTAQGVTPNVGSFLGGGTLRKVGKGMEMGPANADELALMQRVMAEAMADGAFGVSYALIYPPDAYVDTDELVAICKVVRQYNGVYITHVRSEAEQLHQGIGEAIEIGRRAGCPVEIYHLKASGEANWHKMPEIIEMIGQARADGVDVTADMYPYTASGTGLTALFPTWAAANGHFFDNLQDRATRQRIWQEMQNPAATLMAARPEQVMPIGFRLPAHQEYVGQRLSEIAAARDQDWIDAAIDLLLAERQSISTIYFKMSEENVRLQLQQPWMKISTDAGGVDPAWASPRGPVHPRGYGTYPRVLGKYVRAERVITLEDAIRKMTSSVAARLSLPKRGVLSAGYYADVVIFDPDSIVDRATFAEPHQLSHGVRDVWVNGRRVLQDGLHTGATPGSFVSPQAGS